MTDRQVVVIGAGVGGLTAALLLAARGQDVTVVEQAAGPGGKLRPAEIAGQLLDAGPTVFTMRWVFEELFAAVGSTLERHVTLLPARLLARHAWSAEQRLDLFASIDHSADAIGAFAGPAEARRFRGFCARARQIYQTLETPFLRSAEPSPLGLVQGAGLRGLGDLWRISPFATLWKALGEHFHDQRLRQLFGRYATYCGSSPYLAPATLMLVAHVEQDGVWLVGGGMHRLAQALADLAASHGARLRYGTAVAGIELARGRVSGVTLADGERVAAQAVVVNADAAALPAGKLGGAVRHAAAAVPASARSLSALTWLLVAQTDGFPLVRHNVFFSADYAAEFDAIFSQRRLPAEPTVYVCAQDRADHDGAAPAGPERLLCLVNAPPTGDVAPFERQEILPCEDRTFALLARCGLSVERTPERMLVTTPAIFEQRYPATGGALYGQASHGWRTSFARPTARTKVPGLYLAGGSTHPGPGVPMAALSGRLAAGCLLADLTSGGRFR